MKFLTDCGITIEPLFYQQLTLNLFISLIEKALPVTVDVHTNIKELIYEGQCAIRYIEGYIVRSIHKDCTVKETLLGLDDLHNSDDNMEPSESEEWMCAIDRGGLIRINDSFYYTLYAIEYSTRCQFNITGIDTLPCTLTILLKMF